MKNISKILLAFVTISSVSVFQACRNTAPQINLECQRLQGCYASYASLVKDPVVKNLIETAQRNGEMTLCSQAIVSLSKEIKQECPF
ncbi:MAG: hypothetical protein ACK4IX_03415 [Candidatus Sericytochromatia bacterium]